jgi:undecaprenyl-diphosphatase
MDISLLESIVLGIIQGIAEWLPISSQALIALAKIHLFGAGDTSEIIELAIFLHLGTFFAALIYLRHDVTRLLEGLFNWNRAEQQTKIELRFLIIVTIISGILGFALLKLIDNINGLLSSGQALTLLIGIALLITAWLQLSKKEKGTRAINDIKTRDGILLGVAQSLSIIPGISRSGITVASMLFQKIDGYQALRLSFLMSLPIVLGANILLNFSEITNINATSIVALAVAFISGLATIHWLLKLAHSINFGWLALIFGTLSIIAVVI